MIRKLLCAAALLTCASCTTAPAQQPRVLIFSKTTGYRHDSIAVAVPAVEAIAARIGAVAEASEDPAAFDHLDRYAAIVLLSSTTDPKHADSEWLVGPRRAALQRFVHNGGGVVALHAAADSHYHWPWYGQMIGGQFVRHPSGTPTGRLTVVAPGQLTAMWPRQFDRTDEWYQVRGDRPASSVLITLDAATIGESGAARPMSWAREFEGGRVFTTLMGHTSESYTDPRFLAHVEAGLRWTIHRR